MDLFITALTLAAVVAGAAVLLEALRALHAMDIDLPMDLEPDPGLWLHTRR